MRKFSWIICCAILTGCLLFILPTEARAVYSEVSEGGIIYYTEYRGEATITDFAQGPNYYLDIPSTLGGYPVTAIGDFAFYECSKLLGVVIPEGVTRIGVAAFGYCTKLGSVTIPDSVNTIGDSAFIRCYALSSIAIPDGVTSIGRDAFENCSNLARITIGKGVEFIGMRAFYDCSSLNAVHISDIAAWCNIIYESPNYTPLQMAGSLYVNGRLVTDLVIPEGVTSISMGAFYGCESVTSVSLPASVTSIGDYAFRGCPNLVEVHITDVAAWCSIDFGVAAHPFYDSSGKLYLNEELVTDLMISDGVTAIGRTAFYNCTGLTSISIPASVTTIGKAAFYNCTGLTSVSLPASVTAINGSAFHNCTGLTDVGIPASVTAIGSSAFENCGSLTDVHYTGTQSQWEAITIGSNNSLLTSATRHYNGYTENYYTYTVSGGEATIIGYSNSISDKVIIPTALGGYPVTAVGCCAFYGCDSLTRIAIPSGVTSINHYAFSNCNNLISVDIPSSVTTIGYEAFEDCASLTDVYYAGVQSQWDEIAISNNNNEITHATVHCNHIHDYSLLPPVSVTYCDQVGYTEYTCVYGETYRDIIPALGHKKGGDVTVVAPTCEERGYTAYSCIQCGGIVAENYVESLGHNHSGTITVVAPTCEERGYTTTKCVRCDSVVVSDYLNALGHSMVASPPLAPTCTGVGLGLGTHCERCQMIGVAQTQIDALGHSFVNGVCTTCGEPETRYTVVFQNYNGVIISQKTYVYGETVEIPAAPIKAADNTYTYAFAGWDKEVASCTGDATYTATYAPTYIDYTVTFKNWDGSLISSKTYHYGDAVTPPAAPTRESSNTYKYTFSGWNYTVTACAESKTYTAVYTSEHIDYTIIFKNYDGTVISSEVYHYGDYVIAPTPTGKPADNKYTYNFAGWDSSVVPCNGNKEYVATYTPQYINYTVAFQYEDGTVIKQYTLHYGDSVVAPADPAVPDALGDDYEFAGWDKEITDCQGNTVYTAVFEKLYTSGDIDGSGTVDQDDAVYLLLHTMFGEAFYPLNNAPADIDGSGTVDQDDAVYLLLHTMFGETFYPLNTPALPAKTKE